MKKKPEVPVKVGAWYTPRVVGRKQDSGKSISNVQQTPRWVLGVSESSGRARVIYSRGASKHYECLISTFRVWMRHTRASTAKRRKEVFL